MNKILITTSSFADKSDKPILILKKNGLTFDTNKYKRKLSKDELINLINDYDILIAGTEIIDKEVISCATNLKLICRVGVGYENIDLRASKNKGIKITYTPDSPAPAIAELTTGMMLSLLRHTHVSNLLMRDKKWYRFLGRRITEVTIGIIGAGRIGTEVIRMLSNLKVKKILVSDIKKDVDLSNFNNVFWSNNDEIYKNADIISLHLPLNSTTQNMISKKELKLMKKEAILINTSRGSIVNEKDLLEVLESGHLESVGIDVFDEEPYKGPLINIERCLLTSHIGSLSEDCRIKMEVEAVEEVVRFVKGQNLRNEIPELMQKNS
tara:strand:+ start:54756 stop:55727 length:972 start_codon:yes stop_codon:yes gene_type:complete